MDQDRKFLIALLAVLLVLAGLIAYAMRLVSEPRVNFQLPAKAPAAAPAKAGSVL